MGVTELLALIGRHLREITRDRLTRAVVVLFAVGIAVALYVGSQAVHGDALVVVAVLVFLAVGVAGVAVGVGSALPEDRVAGREAWLSTLAPAAWKRRVAAALAGWLLAVAGGALGGLLAGLAASIVPPAPVLHASRAVPVPAEAFVPAAPDAGEAGATWTLPWAPPAQAGATLDLDVRPRFRRLVTPIDRVDLAWTCGARQGELTTSVRGSVRIPLESGDDALQLASRTPHVDVRVLGARILCGPVPPPLALTLAGLLLGLLAGSVAPVAVLVSRATTGQTAAAAAACLLFFGTTRGALLDLATGIQGEGASAVASTVFGVVSRLAPDTPMFHVVSELSALRALGPAALALALPALLYTAVVLLLVAVPAPRARFEGVDA